MKCMTQVGYYTEGRKTKMYSYKIRNKWLNSSTAKKDLGVVVDCKLKHMSAIQYQGIYIKKKNKCNFRLH